MRTPREAFLSSGKCLEFRKVVAGDAFEVACEYALLQLQSEMLPNTLPGKPVDPYAGMDANAQMHGASRVLAILHSLGIEQEPKKKPIRETLHYEKTYADRSTPSSTPSTSE